MKDYYGLMEIVREATSAEIKRAYRKLAMMYHPDKNRGDPECEERLKEINEAYRILGDEEKKRQYDFICRKPYSSNAFFGGDPSDNLREFYGGGFSVRGPGACRGVGFRKKGCGRWKRNIWKLHSGDNRTMAYKPEVNAEKCTGCGECVDICPVDVYELKNNKSVPVHAEECLGCDSCITACEHEAITVTEI